MRLQFIRRRLFLGAAVLGVLAVALAVTSMGILAQSSRDTNVLTSTALRKLPALGITQEIKPTNRVREFTLTAASARWTLANGVQVDGVAFNGAVPGPVLRVTEGDTVRVTVVNSLADLTSIHWHGLHVPNAMDGVPGITQEPIPPGGRKSYEFLASHAGTFMYHPHGPGLPDIDQIDRGLYGLFIIDPQKAKGPKYARDYAYIIGGAVVEDGAYGGMSMSGMSGTGTSGHGQTAPAGSMSYNAWPANGKLYPGITPITVKVGEVVRVRFANISNASHPMHLHGHDFRVIAIDGEPLERPLLMNTFDLAPGQTADLDFVADNPGVWAFHCHELHHAEQGLLLLVQYEGYGPMGERSPAPTPSMPMDSRQRMPGINH
jgi:FtsP/CotA-like multicopper oxidase with cupredoxin domain